MSGLRNAQKLCKPDKVVWIDGTEGMRKRLEKQACATGEVERLNQKKDAGDVYCIARH